MRARMEIVTQGWRFISRAKLSNLYVGIGYPETWRDYSAYEVKADDIFGNLWRGGLFD